MVRVYCVRSGIASARTRGYAAATAGELAYGAQSSPCLNFVEQECARGGLREAELGEGALGERRPFHDASNHDRCFTRQRSLLLPSRGINLDVKLSCVMLPGA